MAGEELSGFVRPSEVEAGMAIPGLPTSRGLKPLILTRSEAAGWQLVHVSGVAPSTGAWGGAPGSVRGACPGLLAPFQSLGEMWHLTSQGLQQQEGQEQHSPGKWEEAGGSTVTDAV